MNIKIPRTVITTVLLLFCSGIAQAQQKQITIDEAVEIATKNYPTLKIAQFNVEKEKALKTTAWDFGTTQIFTSADEIGNNNTEEIYTTIGFGQNNIDVFSVSSKNKLANENIKLAETQVELSILEIKRKVQMAWSKAYTKRRIYQAYAKIDSVFSGLNKAIDLRYETKAISKLEYNAMANQGKLISLQKERAYTNYQMALHVLNQYLQSDDLYDVASLNLDNIEKVFLISNKDLKKHPIFSYWKNREAVTKAKYKVANAQFLPKLSAQYRFQKIGNQAGFNGYQIGVEIPLIFNKTKGAAKASKMKINIVEQENKVNQIEFENTYNNLLLQHNQLQKNWRYYKHDALPLAIEQRNGAILSYKEGAMDYVAFLQTTKAAIQLEIDTWQMLHAYLNSTIQLVYFLTSKS